MLHAAHEGTSAGGMYGHPLRPSRPTNEFFVFAVEKDPPRKCSRFSGADRFSPCRLHAAIYEPIVYYLGIARGIVKRATTIGRASRLGCWKIIHPCTVRRIRRR